jgi:hypothetical protein
MAKVKNVPPPKVNIYFGRYDKQLLEKFIKVAQKYNIAESRLGVMALRKGLKEVVKELDTQETKTKMIDET